MSAVELAPTSLPKVGTVRDALTELLRVVAVRDALKAYEDQIRVWLRSEYDRLEGETGTAPNFAAKGLGRAYMTDPSWKPQIVDREKVAALAREAGVAVQRDVVDSSALQHDIDKGAAEDGLLAALRDEGYLRAEWLLPEGWLDGVAESCVVDGGRLVDPSSGEVVEGVEMVASSRPTLTFRADPAARKAMVARLSATLPQIGGAP